MAELGLSVPLLTIAALCPCGVHSAAGADRFHIQEERVVPCRLVGHYVLGLLMEVHAKRWSFPSISSP